jgi:hypothetical protein
MTLSKGIYRKPLRRDVLGLDLEVERALASTVLAGSKVG